MPKSNHRWRISANDKGELTITVPLITAELVADGLEILSPDDADAQTTAKGLASSLHHSIELVRLSSTVTW